MKKIKKAMLPKQIKKCKQQLIVHGALTNENNNQLCIVQEIKNNDADSCESYRKYVRKGT